jgi:PAS domain S-box-containing protein
MAGPVNPRAQWLLLLLLAAVPAFVAGVAYAQRDQRPEQWLVALLAMGLGLLLAWLGRRTLIEAPLAPVLETVRRVAEGDLSARTATARDGHGDLRRLAREVDAMAEALARRDRALTEAIERAEAYLDVVGVMVILLNPRGSVLLANRMACEVLGRDARQCQARDWFNEFVPAEERDAARATFAALLTDGAMPGDYHEHHVLTAAGGRRLIAWRQRALRDAQGMILGVLSAGQDITEQRHTENELRDSRERYRGLVQNLPGVVYRCEPQPPWRARFISAEIQCLTGQPASAFEASTLTLHELIHADDRAEVERAVADGVATRQPYTCVYRMRHTDGHWRWVQERGRAVYDDQGRPEWLDGVMLDITELRALQEEQARLQAHLQQAQKMEALGQLTGGIAHDFNNILASVLGFTRLALRRHGADTPGELGDFLREVIAAGERGRDLVARMLAFSRARPERAARALPPRPLVEEVVKMLRATIPATITLEVDADADLPEVAIDPVDLHQILMNLIINARDALPGHGCIRVSLRHLTVPQTVCAAGHEPFAGAHVVLGVADDGQGIPPEALPHIFEPFFTTKAAGRGSGMGLAMAHALARRAGAHFTVQSCPRRGTTIDLYLPVAAPLPTVIPTATDAPAVAPPAPQPFDPAARHQRPPSVACGGH